MNLRAVRQMDLLYRQLPPIQCKGECQNACGPIAMTELEVKRIEKRRRGRLPQPVGTTCPLLTPDGRCSVYGVRPLICRLWGSVEDLRCAWGCEPDWYLTPEQARDILQQALEIGGKSVWLASREAMTLLAAGREDE